MTQPPIVPGQDPPPQFLPPVPPPPTVRQGYSNSGTNAYGIAVVVIVTAVCGIPLLLALAFVALTGIGR